MERNIDFSKPNQHLMSIIVDGVHIGGVEIDEDGHLATYGQVGENKYNNFVELIYGLQGFGIKIDDFYF